MNEHTIVSLIALTGFLILVVSALGSRRLSFKQVALLAGGWVAIFAVVTLFIGMIAE